LHEPAHWRSHTKVWSNLCAGGLRGFPIPAGEEKAGVKASEGCDRAARRELLRVLVNWTPSDGSARSRRLQGRSAIRRQIPRRVALAVRSRRPASGLLILE